MALANVEANARMRFLRIVVSTFAGFLLSKFVRVCSEVRVEARDLQPISAVILAWTLRLLQS